MKRSLVYIVLIIFCFILQATVFRSFSFAGIVPNLLIIVTASLGFMRGARTGLAVGFLCGLLMDIFFGDVIGFHALLYMYIGFINGLLTGFFFPERIKQPLFMITLSNIFYGMLSYLILFMMRGRFNFNFYLINVILPEVVYTVLAALILYPLILWLDGLLDGRNNKAVTTVNDL
ncbi:MAG: rod shape-determining protein MreD [Lachnospiraceae bacterium]|jgi:rod shape-determining protein MreD|nr:rod shape-determining protein MreD [Lachnospiraceae bacterium]